MHKENNPKPLFLFYPKGFFDFKSDKAYPEKILDDTQGLRIEQRCIELICCKIIFLDDMSYLC